MEGKIVTDICVLAFFITLIALRKYLFTEGFLKFLKENWFILGLVIVGIYMITSPEQSSSYQGYIFVMGTLFVLYFFLFGYFKVYTLKLREKKGFKKTQTIYFPFLSLFGLYAAYDYFTTEQYNILDIAIFVFFLSLVIYVSNFLFKETFFRKNINTQAKKKT